MTKSAPRLAIVSILWYIIEVRVFKNTWFERFADKEGITDDELMAAINRLEAGQFYANLGGGLYKVKERAKKSFSFTDENIRDKLRDRELIEVASPAETYY